MRTASASTTLVLDSPLPLDSGRRSTVSRSPMRPMGELAADKGNAILVCHGLTGDQHAASEHPLTGKPCWWARMVGPGLPIDTDRFHVICANIIGGCMGSTGPASLGADGKPQGMCFPVITIRDMVRAQVALLDAAGDRTAFYAVVGGSMGGMIALRLAAHFPDSPRRSGRSPPPRAIRLQNIAFTKSAVDAIRPIRTCGAGWCLRQGARCGLGRGADSRSYHLSVRSRADREVQPAGCRIREAKSFGFDADLPIESYLR